MSPFEAERHCLSPPLQHGLEGRPYHKSPQTKTCDKTPSRAICSVTAFPQSPPCATKRVYPRRFISTTHALAMRMGSQPSSVGAAENPWPGSDGITTSNASDALPPCAVGFVSGSMSFNCSMIEPGQPCVTIIGNACGCVERTWMKCMSTPSIVVMNCGRALSFASHWRRHTVSFAGGEPTLAVSGVPGVHAPGGGDPHADQDTPRPGAGTGAATRKPGALPALAADRACQ